MSLKLFDYECDNCGTIVERLVETDNEIRKRCHCGCMPKRIISFGRSATSDTWTRDSANALLDMEVARKSKDPVERELAVNPNRENLERYMRARGLRFAENEKGAPPVYRRPPEPDLKEVADKLYKQHRERTRIEL